MTDTRTNAFGQPIGLPVDHWTGRVRPPRTVIVGRYCRLEPLDAGRHAADLFEAYSDAPDERDWTYLVPQKPASLAAYRETLAAEAPSEDPLRFVVVDSASDKAVGRLALMRIDTLNGVIEVGGIMYSRRLQRKPAGTEAVFLCATRAFDELGYRRLEWKCDALNAASRAAALRYGFTFEGIFRQAMVYHGRNRDTAWYSMLDGEWPRVRRAFERWLDRDNFDEQGRQRRSLSELREV